MDKKTYSRKQSVYWLRIVFLGVILGLGIQFAQATALPSFPRPTPPNGSVSGPITSGLLTQYKVGSLGVNSVSLPIVALEVGGIGNAVVGGSIGSNGTITAPTFCIGADCRNAWPSAAAGVTSLSEGTGVTLSPNPITSTGAISVDTGAIQKRVSTICTEGVIKSINADGTATCRLAPPGTLLYYQCPGAGNIACPDYPCSGNRSARSSCYNAQYSPTMGCKGCGCYLNWISTPCTAVYAT